MTVLRLGTNHSKNTSKSKNANKTARDEALKKCPAMGSQPPSQPPQNSCDGIFPENSHNGVFATEQPWWCLPQNSICLRTDGICIKKTLSRSLGQVQAPKQSIASTHTHTHKFTLHQREKKKKFFIKGSTVLKCHAFLMGSKVVKCKPTLRASLSGTLLRTLPELLTPLKGHSLSPCSCPPMWSAPSERFGYPSGSW